MENTGIFNLEKIISQYFNNLMEDAGVPGTLRLSKPLFISSDKRIELRMGIKDGHYHFLINDGSFIRENTNIKEPYPITDKFYIDDVRLISADDIYRDYVDLVITDNSSLNFLIGIFTGFIAFLLSREYTDLKEEIIFFFNILKKLLKTAPYKKSPIGLMGELKFLTFLIEKLGNINGDLIDYWTGYSGTSKDFQIKGGIYVEIKSITYSQKGLHVTINGSEQLNLDEESGDELYLVVYVFRKDRNGESLFDIIENLYEVSPSLKLVLPLILSEIGIDDRIIEELRSKKYKLTEGSPYIFRVDENFPKITPDLLKRLPNSNLITDVRYTIDLNSIEPISEEELIDRIRSKIADENL